MERRFQSGCVFKRGKRRKVWVARWREPQKMADGTIGTVQRSEILGTVTEMSKSQAQNALAVKLSPLNSGKVRPGSVMTFREFAVEWEKTVLGMYRPSTREFYKATLDRWVLPYWSQWRLMDIRLMDVRKWLNGYTATYATSVVKHMRSTLSKMLSDALEMGHLDRNPAKGFRTPRGKTVRRVVALSPAQIAVVLSKLEEPLRTAVRLVGVLGLRESELAALRPCDLDFSSMTITVRQSRYRGESSEVKTEGSARVLPMPASIGERLRLLADTCPAPETPIFRTATGQPVNFDGAVKYTFAPLARAAGLPHFTWRSFRRGASTQMHRNGIPVKVAQGILGHATPQVTLGIYTETSLEDMRLAVEGLERGFAQNVPSLVQ